MEKNLDARGKISSADLAQKAKQLRSPNLGTPYYFVTSTFTVDVCDWQGARVDSIRKEIGNYFLDRETAMKFAERTIRFFSENNS